jgi:L-histidine N-alpha-methyltransferase
MSHSSSAPAHKVVLDSQEEGQQLEFALEVESGLSSRPMRIPCRFLYDSRGSELFERICDLPEYYPTRAEASILSESSDTIRELTGPVNLIELGSGTSVKTDYLLEAYCAGNSRVRYVPVDVSESAIRIAERSVTQRHTRVDVEGIVDTYEKAFPLFKEHSPSMVIFLGSTIGNCDEDEASEFWQRVKDSLCTGDYFLLGADLVKDVAVIEAAYNDSQGVTAAFMKNLFVRMNRELGSELDLEQIEHVADYNTESRQVEICARFSADQELNIEPLDRCVRIEAGSDILLEVSRKFVVDDLIEYLSDYGLDTKQVFTDAENRFCDLLLQKR